MNCLQRKVANQSPGPPAVSLNSAHSRKEFSSEQTEEPMLSDQQVTAELVWKGLGWRSTPDRFLKPKKSWVPRSRFKPLSDLRHAFELLEAVTNDYRIIETPGTGFVVEVRIGKMVGRASGPDKARCISLALARAMQIPWGGGK